MNDTLRRCLDDLEARIDPAVEAQLLWEWRSFTENRSEEDIFSPRRRKIALPTVEWPRVSVNDGLADYDQMALQQYGACSAALARGSGMMLNVRCNYGSSIAPLLFGVKAFIMGEEFDTLPTSEPLNDKDAIRRLIDAGIPDLRAGFGEKVLEMGRRYAAIAREYPKIGKYVNIYHPDLQGPLDICEVVWAARCFTPFTTNPNWSRVYSVWPWRPIRLL